MRARSIPCRPLVEEKIGLRLAQNRLRAVAAQRNRSKEDSEGNAQDEHRGAVWSHAGQARQRERAGDGGEVPMRTNHFISGCRPAARGLAMATVSAAALGRPARGRGCLLERMTDGFRALGFRELRVPSNSCSANGIIRGSELGKT